MLIVGQSVFCQCNSSSGVTSMDILFGAENFLHVPLVEIFDDITVKMTVPLQFYGPVIMFCILLEDRIDDSKDHPTDTKTFEVIPILKVIFFECRSFPNEEFGNCTFTRPGSTLLEKKYFLSGNGLPNVRCAESPMDQVECKNIPINPNITTNHFQIEMEVMGYSQIKDMTLNLTEIVVPNWEFIKAKFHFLYSVNSICIWISSQYEGLFCRWIHQPWNPRKYMPHTIDLDEAHMFIMCVPGEIIGYKKFENRVSCRFGLDELPWSEEYIFNCTTRAILPSKPPQILPNGFFCDTDRDQLYVFWLHLEERDWNGPDFGYAAQSTDG